MMPAPSHLPSPSSHGAPEDAALDSSPSAALVSTEGHVLPLAGASIRAEAGGGIARVVLEQRFRNVHDVPLHVTYTLPLPADGAVSGFSFRLGAQRIVGEIDRRAAARERFEEALLSGHGAALLEQERSSLFTQELGNIPAGAEVVAEIVIDQRLQWLAEGAWEWRFPTTVAPRYLGAPGRVADADRLATPIADGPIDARLGLSLCIRDALAPQRRPESPSHALRAEQASDVRWLDAAGVPLDRDVVVRWAVAGSGVQTSLEAARASGTGRAYGLLTLVPPLASAPAVGRDVVVLLDTSGSMSGEPLAQACRVVSAVIATLGAADQLEMIQFSSAPRSWRREPVAVTPAIQREALEWLATRRASGGTEMRAGIERALIARRDHTQRQVLLVTDGFIGFEAEVVRAIASRQHRATRVHTVGVGSAVNRSLTSAAARAGRGTEHIIGLGEDAEPAARRIVAATASPLVVDLELSGSAFLAHAGLPDLFAGRPALIPLALDRAGGELVVRGRTATGPWQQRLAVGAIASGAGRAEVITLFGRERVEELEMRVATGEAASSSDVGAPGDEGSVRDGGASRDGEASGAAGSSSWDAEIERVGLEFGIATRLTSWVAVSESPSVDPQSPIRRERMPHALAHGLSAEAVGLRRSAATVSRMSVASGAAPFMTRSGAPLPPAPSGAVPRMSRPPRSAPPARSPGVFERFVNQARGLVTPRGPGAPRGGASGGAASGGAASGADAPARGAEGRAGELSWRGRVVMRHPATRLVIEIEIDETLDWEQPSHVTIEWSDGTTSSALLDAGKSTRAATLSAGQSARLILSVSADDVARQPRLLHLTLGGRAARVQL